MRLLRGSPTFYSFLGGIFVSLATNMFTGLFMPGAPKGIFLFVYLSIAGFVLGSCGFLWLSLRLEAIRENTKGQDLEAHLRSARGSLVTALMLSAAACIAGFAAIFVSGR